LKRKEKLTPVDSTKFGWIFVEAELVKFGKFLLWLTWPKFSKYRLGPPQLNLIGANLAEFENGRLGQIQSNFSQDWLGQFRTTFCHDWLNQIWMNFDGGWFDQILPNFGRGWLCQISPNFGYRRIRPNFDSDPGLPISTFDLIWFVLTFDKDWSLMSVYFCPHSVFNSGYLIEFMCLKSDLIDNSDN